MELVVYARYGSYPSGVKCFKRKLNVETIKKTGKQYLITFSQSDYDKFEDFKNRIKNQAGNFFSFSFHIINSNKWFESRIIDREENSLKLIFNIFKEDYMIYGSCLEL